MENEDRWLGGKGGSGKSCRRVYDVIQLFIELQAVPNSTPL